MGKSGGEALILGDIVFLRNSLPQAAHVLLSGRIKLNWLSDANVLSQGSTKKVHYQERGREQAQANKTENNLYSQQPDRQSQ
ncbi:hypothetical protein T12_2769 [Trichinella patagoniensis]|uniref:Uncharacterized protein n=1 Tax=Trichinella patagoniensis TaxID=990121 RepID=A0A0V0ZS67_9BILA|nr:hypothetical protein T12_2769 [Trichinella patagoniensis]